MTGYGGQAKRLRALAHPVRLEILEALREQPACVCELVALTNKRQPYISQQLALLRKAGLVKAEREGVRVRYQLVEPETAQWMDGLWPLLERRWAVRDEPPPAGYTPSDADHPILAPSIEEGLCTGCRSCVDACLTGILAWEDGRSLPVIIRSAECEPGCESCALARPAGAISLPGQHPPDAPTGRHDGRRRESAAL